MAAGSLALRFTGAVNMQSCQQFEMPTARMRGGQPGGMCLERTGICRAATTFLRLAVVLLASLSFCQRSHGQEDPAIDREYTIKAAFLYHFLTYIDWPAGTFVDPQQPFVIGVFETDPFGAVLDKIAATKNVAGRPIEIRRLQSTESLLECHIVFIPEVVDPAAQRNVLSIVANSHVLAVGETDDFVELGGAAQFFVEGNKVRFAFNTDVVERNQLKVSSKLLSLAKIVSTR
jgi:YfiR/HmsC-like